MALIYFMKIVTINPKSSLPKYKQIVLSVEAAIAENRLKKGDKLPSINKVSIEFSISRDTILLAYNELKKRGIIYAILGKGYYVKSVEFSFEKRIFLLFDELNSFKEDLYNSFLEKINNTAQIDIFFHHFNAEMFKKLVNDANGNYSKYIIMPTNFVNACDYIRLLPREDVYILDQTNDGLKEYPSVYQNFEKDIYDSLHKGKHLLDKYQKLILIFPGFREPLGMKLGFEKFCIDFHFHFEIIEAFAHKIINIGDVYVIPNDRDLVQVIEKSKIQHLKLGVDFGIISYNETPLKKLVENGITTISTDFEAMGKIIAQIILKGTKKQVENKCNFLIRNSL